MAKDNQRSDRKFAEGHLAISVAVALVCLGATTIKQPEWAAYIYLPL